jgi:hypothetical protein
VGDVGSVSIDTLSAPGLRYRVIRAAISELLEPSAIRTGRAVLTAGTGKEAIAMPDQDLRQEDLRIIPWGPEPAVLEAAARAVGAHPNVRALLNGTEHRLLRLRPLTPEAKTARPVPPKEYEAVFYDYTNNRAVVARGRLGTPDVLDVADYGSQPRPSAEEYAAAVELVRQDRELGRLLEAQRLEPYPPMPPLVMDELPDGRVERTLAVGLLPRADGVRHEIVAVNLIRKTISHFAGGAPPLAQAHNPICGLPISGAAGTSNAGNQVSVTVSQGGTVLWRFQVVRPSASSGTNGSGIELRHVNYRGRSVLYRAHVPILNVKYDGDACGPYRDWQDQENAFAANGADVGGFRVCPAPAQTILDSGSDVGNFRGVAIYVQGQEAVLVSEMSAGWYRYISEWRFHTNGTIRPRFGFSAVSNSCVCTRHHHHVYWRLDFDIRTAGGNRVREFNNPPLGGGANWHTKSYEIRRPRDPARQRRWRVEHTATGAGYEIVPGPDDGMATASPDWPFPRGDVWILRYRGTEIDDGVVATGPPYEAGLDGWVTGEAIDGRDVVVWYGGHFTHDPVHEPPGAHGHVIGPDLVPVNW